MRSGGIFGKMATMKASEKAKRRWASSKRRPAFKKIAGSKYWLDDDTQPREPKGGPRRKV